MMLKQMSSLVPELAQTEEDEFFVERDSETPARVGRGLSLRDMDAYADTKEAYEEEMLQDEETNLYDRIKLSTETEEETVQYK